MEVGLSHRRAVDLRLHHGPHHSHRLLRCSARLKQVVASSTVFKCCAATSHLQHKVGIPNSWPVRVAVFAISELSQSPNLLADKRFRSLARLLLGNGQGNFANGVKSWKRSRTQSHCP